MVIMTKETTVGVLQVEGTAKNLARMRQGYTKYIAKGSFSLTTQTIEKMKMNGPLNTEHKKLKYGQLIKQYTIPAKVLFIFWGFIASL